MSIRRRFAGLRGLQRAQFLDGLARDGLNVVIAQVLIEPGEDGFVPSL